jgi:hypothetical protein
VRRRGGGVGGRLKVARKEQREDLRRYARGLRAWLRGDEDAEALAAGCNVAEVLVMIRSALVDEERR